MLKGSTGGDRRPSQICGPSKPTLAVATLATFCIPFDPIALLYGRTVALPFILLLACLVGIDYIAGRRSPSMPLHFCMALSAYFIWTATTFYWSYSPDASLATVVQMFVRGALVVSLAFVVPQHWRRIAESYLFGAVALAMWILSSGEEQYLGRLTLLGADENALGLSLAVGFAFSLVRVTESRLAGTMLYGALSGLLAIATLATGSRAGLIALSVVVVVRLLSGQQRRRFVQLAAVGAGFAWLAMFLWRSGAVPERVALFLQGRQLTDSRGSILDLFFAYPDWMLFGTGINADAAYMQHKSGQYLFVHNLYIGVWVQLGILGLVLLLAVLVMAALQALRSDRRDMWLAAAAAVFVYTLTLPGQASNVYWFVIAFGVAGYTSGHSARTSSRKAFENAPG